MVTSEDETVADIVNEMRDALGVDSADWFTGKHVRDFADRISAAHDSEVAALRRENGLTYAAELSAVEEERGALKAKVERLENIIKDTISASNKCSESFEKVSKIEGLKINGISKFFRDLSKNIEDAMRGESEPHGDCVSCVDDPDFSCPWCGEPDGCNNRELGERVRKEVAK